MAIAKQLSAPITSDEASVSGRLLVAEEKERMEVFDDPSLLAVTP
jgi:hypothetical protein